MQSQSLYQGSSIPQKILSSLCLQVRCLRGADERDRGSQPGHEHPGLSARLGSSVAWIQLCHGRRNLFLTGQKTRLLTNLLSSTQRLEPKVVASPFPRPVLASRTSEPPRSSSATVPGARATTSPTSSPSGSPPSRPGTCSTARSARP